MVGAGKKLEVLVEVGSWGNRCGFKGGTRRARGFGGTVEELRNLGQSWGGFGEVQGKIKTNIKIKEYKTFSIIINNERKIL